MEEQNFKILIADDSATIRKLLKIKLEKHANFQLIFKEDGVQALDYINKNKVHVVITDLQMPNMDGLTLLKKIKYKNSLIPIIVISSYDSSDNIEKVYKHLALKFYPKPIDIEGLIKTLKKVKLEQAQFELSQKFLPDIEITFNFKIYNDNFKFSHLLIKKIIDMTTTVYNTGYEISTNLYVILSDYFQILKDIVYNNNLLSENTFLDFSFIKSKTSIKIVIAHNKKDINFEEIYNSDFKTKFTDFESQIDILGFDNDGFRMVIEKII